MLKKLLQFNWLTFLSLVALTVIGVIFIKSAGEALWLASGKETDILDRIFRGEDVGTLFLPASSRKKKMESRKRWLSSFSRPHGRVAVDDQTRYGQGGGCSCSRN